MQTIGLLITVLSAFFLGIFIFDAHMALEMMARVKNAFGINALFAWPFILASLTFGLVMGIAMVALSLIPRK